MESPKTLADQLRSRVTTERALISGLDGKLLNVPYLRERVQHASFLLDDAENHLRPSSLKGPPDYVALRLDVAQFNIGKAAQERQKVQELFDKYGPSIQEIGT